MKHWEVPLPIDGGDELAGAKQLALGKYHSCAVDAEGNVYSWGWGGSFFGGKIFAEKLVQ